jgi:hypothetical protein
MFLIITPANGLSESIIRHHL